MQENNFEKQVQEKMDDLRIDPSGELWQKVSSRIGKKKRDHRVLLVCLSTLLLLIIGGITWLKTSNNDQPLPTIATEQATHKEPLPETAKKAESNKTNTEVNSHLPKGNTSADISEANDKASIEGTTPKPSSVTTIAGNTRGNDRLNSAAKANPRLVRQNKKSFNQSAGAPVVPGKVAVDQSNLFEDLKALVEVAT